MLQYAVWKRQTPNTITQQRELNRRLNLLPPTTATTNTTTQAPRRQNIITLRPKIIEDHK